MSDKTMTDVFAQDLRHLIVCDTEFIWTGRTTLELPEIERLVARGWLAEGDENAEYEVTDEGKAVIESRLSVIADRLRGEAQAEQQPAAWRRRHSDGEGGFHGWLLSVDDPKRHENSEYEPLYTRPQAALSSTAAPDGEFAAEMTAYGVDSISGLVLELLDTNDKLRTQLREARPDPVWTTSAPRGG